MNGARRDDPIALARRIEELERRNDELRHALAAMRPDDGGAPSPAEEAARAHAPAGEAVPAGEAEAARRAKDLEDAAKQTRARARRAEQSLAYEPPQLKLEIFAPDQTGGVGWNLSIVGSAERVDRALLLVETLLPAYDHFMRLMQDQGDDTRRYRGRLAR